MLLVEEDSNQQVARELIEEARLVVHLDERMCSQRCREATAVDHQ
jgi:hypothetical protein